MVSHEIRDPTELLAEVGGEYRKVREDRDRETPRGSTRRRLAQEMKRLSARFERLLEQWTRDDALREQWRSYLYRGGAQPEQPRLAVPPLFRGTTTAGAALEILPAEDGGYDILVGGSRVEHQQVPWHLEQDVVEPVQIGDWSCTESFATPDEAVAALGVFHGTSGSAPPWEWAPALYEDGLIDTTFAVTPRGLRRLGKTEAPELAAGRRAHYCVLLVSSARARVLTLAAGAQPDESTLAQLQEVADTTNPKARTRDSEWFSDTRPGMRREGPHGPRHGVSDHREDQRKDSQRRFVQLATESAARVWQTLPACKIVVVASPAVLGLLRPAIARQLGPRPAYEVVELARELTSLSLVEIHDALAAADLLPGRGRRPPVLPMRTPNPWQ